MSEPTPTAERAESMYAGAYAWRWEDAPDQTDLSEMRAAHRAEFRRMLAEERRTAAEKAWDAARAEIHGIPHWANPETGQGGFDLQPLGPNESSEEGAFMEVMRVLAKNPYRAKETKA